MPDVSKSEAAQHRRDSFTLMAASVANGLTAYAIAAVGAWAYGASGFAPIANLWTVLTLALAAVAFPLQHWIIRTVAIGGGERSVQQSLSRIVRAVVILSAATLVVSWLLADRLFADSRVFAVFAAVLIVESAVIGLSRGTLVGRGRIRSAAVVMGGENLLRLGACILVLVAGWGVTAYGAAILSGVAIVLLYPSSIRPKSTGAGGAERVLALLGGIGAGTLLSQIVLVSAPLVVAMRTSQLDLITAMFATAALARAPFLIALGLGLQGTALLSRRHQRDPAATARSSVRIAAAGAAAAAIGGVAYGIIAPSLVPMLFGPDTGLSAFDSALVGGASLLAVASLFLSLVLVVLERGFAVTAAWLVAVAVGIGVLALSSASATTATAAAFVAAEGVALVLLVIFAVSRKSGPGRRTPRLDQP